jgi:hypothetical protein
VFCGLKSLGALLQCGEDELIHLGNGNFSIKEPQFVLQGRLENDSPAMNQWQAQIICKPATALVDTDRLIRRVAYGVLSPDRI